jgi:ABC-type nitrate/sulfonate/bicarbonate transport system permease component
MGRRLLSAALALPLVAVLIGLWWWTAARSTSPYYPSLDKVWDSFATLWLPGPGSLLRSDFVPSVVNLLTGWGLAIVVGIAAGVLIGMSDVLWTALRPGIELARATPMIVIFPVIFVIFGFSDWGQRWIILIASLWPILLNTTEGVRSVDPVVRDVARSYRLSRPDRILFVMIPAALPQIMTGLRVAAGHAVVVMVASEYFASTRGVGFQVHLAMQNFDSPATYATTVLLGLIGYVLSLAVRALEHLVLGWHIRMRETARART